jgi:hypothetical protein
MVALSMQPFLKIFKMKYLLLLLLFFTGIAKAQVIPFGMMNTAILTPAFVGDFRDGGVVFYVDPNDNAHGLVCSINDFNNGQENTWWNGSSLILVSGTETGVGTGKANTDKIIDAMVSAGFNNLNYENPAGYFSYAAGIARSYSYGGYTDWFLPSKDELYQLFLNRVAVSNTLTTIAGAGVFPSGSNYNYWTSSEYNKTYAWLLKADSTTIQEVNNQDKKRQKFLRPIRAF